MLSAAVERKFEIIGEALSQAERLYPELRGLVENSQQIIAFRNRVIHGYASLENRLVWSIVEVYLQPLLNQVETLLADIDRLRE